MKPMPSRIIARPRNQPRKLCAQTLSPANPTAPRKPSGRQHARVESAAITAATGVARSATLILCLLLASTFQCLVQFCHIEPYDYLVFDNCDGGSHEAQ